MLEIIIRIDGQMVEPDAMGNLLQGIMVKSMHEQLRHKLGRVICPEHQAQPHVTVDITRGQQHVAVAACCQPLIDRTMQALTAA